MPAERPGSDTETLPAREPGGPDSGNLLVVDDNEANRASLARRLRRRGDTVALAENGRLALEKLRAYAFGYAWIDPEHFAAYLLDVCSHGIGAALFSISVMNGLRARALPGIDFRKPSEVLRALNRTFPMEKQGQMYFTMWYGVYHGPSRELTYACGGHPPAVLVTGPAPDRAELARLKAPGPGVGALPDATFPSRTVKIGPFNRLFLFSDGAFEIVKTDGSLLTLEEFVAQLGQSAQRPGGSLASTLDFLQRLHGTDPYDDDLSLVEITFGA